MSWQYEQGRDNKHKRTWDQPHPGFVLENGELVGKCPVDMSVELASELLNSGIEYSPPRWPHSYPSRIYNVHDGHLYRATPTNPGR